MNEEHLDKIANQVMQEPVPEVAQIRSLQVPAEAAQQGCCC